jgi:NAD(P)-dependent dehydrogenase (short-subunit alcohol dehydrogenase family)
MERRFADKVVLVTAGAGGIGEATCRAFSAEGAKVVISDVDIERGLALAESLSEGGAQARFFVADCTDESQVEALVASTVAAYGRLDIAVNLVGHAVADAPGPQLHQQSVEGWDGTLAVSLRSTFLCIKHEINAMLGTGGGSIVNAASLAGSLYVPDGGAAYAASKAGVIQLTKFAALTYAAHGIRVNCISPGVTPTAAFYKAGPEIAEQMINRMLEGHAIRRPIKTSEQASAILWLNSDEAQMVTGHVLPVDGGWSAR